jgi:hypothetical protein
MFTMMNNARLNVGLQGVAVAERAYQHALAFARDRVQGSRITDKGGKRVAIIAHPDVQRMLLSMKSQVEAARALTYEAAKAMDMARRGDKAAQAKVDLLTPVVKAWCTDVAQEVASTALQVHGGMGFIEETGAAQFFRDARITPIYEGTNGIQAMDLALRKVVMDKGAAMNVWLTEADAALKALGDAEWRGELAQALDGLRQATGWVVKANDPDAVAAVAVPYLNAFGFAAGGVMMARAAATAKDSGAFGEAKLATARFYGAHILPRTRAAVETVLRGSAPVGHYKESFF